MKRGIFVKIYSLTAKIPSGQVSTYGDLAEILGVKDSRIIGWALHKNKDSKIPCHRVVNRNGFLAKNYAFGGEKKQREKLLKEGVKFVKKNQVDLVSCFWQTKK